MNLNNSENKPYSLSIHFVADGFSLYIFDGKLLISSKQVKTPIANKPEQEIIDILAQQEELNANFKQIRVIYYTHEYTIVPAQLYKEDIKNDLLRFQHFKEFNSCTITTNHLLVWNAYLIFSLPEELEKALHRILPEVEIEHHLCAFTCDYIALSALPTLYVYLFNNKIDIIVTKQGMLQFVNSFDFQNSEDLVYYTLKAMELHTLDADNCKVIAFCSEEDKEKICTADKYLKNIEFQRLLYKA